MSFEYPNGDFLKVKAQGMVCPVNTIGVMGAGLAKAFRDDPRFEDDCNQYESWCRIRDRRPDIRPGAVIAANSEQMPVAIFAFTKDHWRQPSKLDWIWDCARRLVPVCERSGFDRVSVPALGCGKGGLDWDEVRLLLEESFERSHVIFQLFPPPR